MPHRNITDEDKERLHWNPDESGTFAGWKPKFGWRVDCDVAMGNAESS